MFMSINIFPRHLLYSLFYLITTVSILAPASAKIFSGLPQKQDHFSPGQTIYRSGFDQAFKRKVSKNLTCNFDLLEMYVEPKLTSAIPVTKEIRDLCPNAGPDSKFCCDGAQMKGLLGQLNRLEDDVAWTLDQYKDTLRNLREIGPDFSEKALKAKLGDKCWFDVKAKHLSNILELYIPKDEKEPLDFQYVTKLFKKLITYQSSFICNICSLEMSSSVNIPKRRLYLDISDGQQFLKFMETEGYYALQELEDLTQVLHKFNCLKNGVKLAPKYTFSSRTFNLGSSPGRDRTRKFLKKLEKKEYSYLLERTIAQFFFPNDALFIVEIQRVINNLFAISKSLVDKSSWKSSKSDLVPVYFDFPKYDHLNKTKEIDDKHRDIREIDSKSPKRMNVSISADSGMESEKDPLNIFTDSEASPHNPKFIEQKVHIDPRDYHVNIDFPNRFRVFKALKPGNRSFQLETFDVYFVWENRFQQNAKHGIRFFANRLNQKYMNSNLIYNTFGAILIFGFGLLRF